MRGKGLSDNYEPFRQSWDRNVDALATALTRDRNSSVSYEEPFERLDKDKFVQEFRPRLDHFLDQVETRVSQEYNSQEHCMNIKKLRRWTTLTNTTLHVISSTQFRPRNTSYSSSKAQRLECLLHPPASDLIDRTGHDKGSICDIRPLEPPGPHLSVQEMATVTNLLTQGPEFQTFQNELRGLVQQIHLFDSLLDENLIRAQQILADDFEVIGKYQYSWLHEIRDLGYTTEQIARILLENYQDAPWIYFDRHNFTGPQPIHGLHAPLCVHGRPVERQMQSRSGSSPFHLSHAPNLAASKDHSLVLPSLSKAMEKETSKRVVQELCGLAGVMPSSRDALTWRGQVDFHINDSATSVTYALPGLGGSERHVTLVSRIYDALEGFLQAAGYIQEAGFCCDCFTILRISNSARHSQIAEMCRIGLYLPGVLLIELKKPRELSEVAPCDLQELTLLTVRILTRLFPDNEFISFKTSTDELLFDVEEFLHVLALTVQFMCLGFLSYSQAHSGAIHPFLLTSSLRTIVLRGSRKSEGDYLQITAQLNDLTCMGSMLQRPILLFSISNVARRGPSNRLQPEIDLLASLEDLMDTWGPGRFVFESSYTRGRALHSIEIGGGTIRATSKDGSIFHWQRDSELNTEGYTTAWTPETKLLIGAPVSVNHSCSADEEQRWLDSSESLDNLGTYRSSWESSQRQAGLQGGQSIIVQYNHTWVKVPGRTLKQSYIDLLDDHLLSFLDANWGLQVSFCTGIGRRVALRKVIADVMPAFIESRSPVPPLWQNLKDHDVIEAFNTGNLQEWVGNISHELQRFVVHTVRYIISTLRHTGVDNDRKHFVIAWIQKNRPFQCFKIPCKNESHWALMLTDSEDCATFAYITSSCLESDHIKCRGPVTRWHNTSSLLETAVCRHLTGEKPMRNYVSKPWLLKHSELYCMGSDPQLWAKVERTQCNDVARLYMSWSPIPSSLLSRLHVKLVGQRLREKPAANARAEDVIVLAGKTSM